MHRHITRTTARQRSFTTNTTHGLACRVAIGLALTAALAVTLNGCAVDTGPDGGGDGGQVDGGGGGGNGGGTDGGPSELAEFVFAVIGDYGDDDDDTRAVADMIKGWNPDFIITVGDNDYSDGGYHGTFTALEFSVGQYFHEFIGNYQGSEGPGADENRFFPTPGDHDWGDTCDDPTGLDDYLRYFTLPSEDTGNERYYDFVRGPVHFFSIHSLEGCEPDGVTPDSIQGQWVHDAALASDAPFKVAYFHQSPYTTAANHIGEGDHMRWPWKDWGLDLVFTGNDHVYERVERDGVIYIVDGLGGVDIHDFLSTPIAGSLAQYNGGYGAVRVEVFDDGLHAEFITVAGQVVDEFDIGTPGQSGGSGGGAGGDWYHPTASTTWQWQLQPNANGEINTTYDVDVYDIDLFDAPESLIQSLQADGRRVICYFSAGSYEDFRDDATEFQSEELGNTLDGFADERWLDIRSENVRRIVQARLDVAADKGCDGVEPDNVDGYANDTGFALTAADQLAYNQFLAEEAHARGLAVGLKNDLDQIDQLVDDFDFTVNEQCHEFDECNALQPFIDADKPVFNAEYDASFVDDASVREALCDDAQARNLRTLILPLDLDDSFRFACEP